MPHLLLTGGGTAGHVVPAMPLIEHFRARGWRLSYVGSAKGPERGLITPLDVPFHAIPTGKLRRYFSLENLVDAFRTAGGVWTAFWLLRDLRPSVVFSKGGFVSVPVVAAAWLQGIPVVAHESDRSPGLANRLALPFVRALCTSFPETRLPRRSRVEVIETGTPLRAELLRGNAVDGRARCGAEGERPLLLVMGGSLGAATINRALAGALPALTRRFFVVHVCGPGHIDAGLTASAGYRAYEYVDEGWGDLLAAADLVVSRAGANTLFELLALGKPNLLIPLGRGASRGDQIENAEYARAAGYSEVLTEEKLSPASLLAKLEAMFDDLPAWRERVRRAEFGDGTEAVAAVIERCAKREPGVNARKL